MTKRIAHNRKNLVGQKFGILTVLARAEDKVFPSGIKTQYLCRCSCGKKISILTCSLTTGNTKSCGCLRLKKLIKRNTTHGQTKTRVHRIWQSMLNRCRNKNQPNYKDYGGRGITVCEEWKTFVNFFQDMGEPPCGYSIERLNNNGNYNLSNCVWATRQQQSRNTRSNRKIVFGGKTRLLCEWAESLGIDQASLRERLEKWPLKEALTRKCRGRISNGK